MATTTASISINSDILSYSLSINKEMTMTQQQSTIGIEETSGLRTKKFTDDTAVAIIEADEYTSGSVKAHKVYIRNTSTNKENYFYVAMNASAAAADTTETIGKLYGQDWMLMPYTGGTNITVASNGGATQYLEYMVFADGMAK